MMEMTEYPRPGPAGAIGEEGEIHARQVHRAGHDLGSGEFGDEAAGPVLDVVPNGAHGVEPTPCGVVELPVLVALAGEDRVGITAAYCDRRIRGLRGIGDEQLGMVGGSDRAHGEGPASGGALVTVPMTASKLCG